MREQGIYPNIDINEYHMEEGLSSTGVSLILDCPKRYWHEFISNNKANKDDKKFELGKALHMMVLEPERFKTSYYLMFEDVDLRTKAGKEKYEQAELEASGRQVIRCADAEVLKQMSESVLSHSFWTKLQDKKVEHSVYWEGGIYNTRLRARPDAYSESVIVDIKTTDSIPGFARSIYSYGYHRQAAMQVDGLASIDGKKRLFAFFVVEKKAPYLTACFTLDDAAIEQGRKEYLEAAMTYSECLQYNVWPGYEEKVQMISLPKWSIKEEEMM